MDALDMQASRQESAFGIGRGGGNRLSRTALALETASMRPSGHRSTGIVSICKACRKIQANFATKHFAGVASARERRIVRTIERAEFPIAYEAVCE
jgi:hypothetical protein